MKKFKLAVIGAGSSYTPELIGGVVKERKNLPFDELTFMDIDKYRLNVMTGFCRRCLNNLQHAVSITPTMDRLDAIEDARFIVVKSGLVEMNNAFSTNESRSNTERSGKRRPVLGE